MLFFEIYIICFLFIVGLLAGKISVIVGLKMPLKEKDYFNNCDYCNKRFKWYELIPVVSYFINKKKCRYCDNKLNYWYPILEFISGILFSLSYVRYGFTYEMLIMIVLTMLLVIISVSDFKYFIILDQPLILFSFIILLVKIFIFGFESFLISLCSGVLIFMFMLMVRYLGNRIFKQESLGGGDIKLAMFFGFLLGIRLSILSLICGSFLAFPYAVYSSLTNKDNEIPFGPFLVGGLYLVFMFQEPIKSFLSIIF